MSAVAISTTVSFKVLSNNWKINVIKLFSANVSWLNRGVMILDHIIFPISSFQLFLDHNIWKRSVIENFFHRIAIIQIWNIMRWNMEYYGIYLRYQIIGLSLLIILIVQYASYRVSHSWVTTFLFRLFNIYILCIIFLVVR